MSTKHPIQENSTEPACLPGGWSRDTAADHRVVEIFVHERTGLEVTVEKTRVPTQMHAPETADDDTGYTARVQGEFGGLLCDRLAAKDVAKKTAHVFMADYPRGEFDVPHPRDQPTGGDPLEW